MTKPTRIVILAAGKGSRMRSDLPKVLHELYGKPLITHLCEKAQELNPEKIIVVVGYKRDMVMAALGDRASYAFQDEQLGTGHAVSCAREELRGFEGNVVVLYGDMPLIDMDTVSRLIERREECNAAGAAVTAIMENPPDFGRIVRDEAGLVQKVVEVKDASPEQLMVQEVNVGIYCFDCQPLLAALERLSNDNAQGEYYLTDAIALLSAQGQSVVTLPVQNLEGSLGIDDKPHLEFAESLEHIRYAESLYSIIDATVAMARKQKTG